jgi:HSP20 family protein
MPRSLLDEVFTALNDFDRGFVGSPVSKDFEVMNAACDITEDPDAFVLSLDVPGMNREDIDIEINSRQLTISGERKREQEANQGNSYRFERSFGKFRRSFELPDNADLDKVEVSYENGVLRIALPKTESAKPRKIQIGENDGMGFLKRLTGKGEPKKAVNS